MPTIFESDVSLPPCPADNGHDGLFRWLTLGCIYAAAVAFCVAASPAVGLITLPSQQAARTVPTAAQVVAALTP